MKKKKARFCFFTLLELIVVMSIIFLASAMSVAIFREQSPSKRLEDASLQWRNFCAGVRYRALEGGRELQILFDPEERLFYMYDPSAAAAEGEEDSEEDPGEEEESDSPFPKRQKMRNELKWTLPEGFELGDFPAADEEPDVENAYVLFTFYGDGTASGKRKLELRIGEEMGKVFEISALTGRLNVREIGNETDR